MGRRLTILLSLCLFACLAASQSSDATPDSTPPAPPSTTPPPDPPTNPPPDPEERPVYEYPLNTPEAEAIRQAELEQLKLLFNQPVSSPSGCPFAQLQQPGFILRFLSLAPAVVEKVYMTVYQALKGNELAYVVVFYSVVGYVVYRTVVGRPASRESIRQWLKTEENSDFRYCEAQLRSEIERAEAAAGDPGHALEENRTTANAAQLQLAGLVETHREFSQEIVDSHAMIIDRIGEELDIPPQPNGGPSTFL